MSRLRLAMAVVAVTVRDTTPAKANHAPKPDHHPDTPGGVFKNPWNSFFIHDKTPNGPISAIRHISAVQREMQPVTQQGIPPVRTPDWGKSAGAQAADMKATWLGHACFLVEFPSKEGQRGLRVLFDPVFSHRCSPSQWVGPARYTPPPVDLKDLPHIDAVVISHNHYDHTDSATLQTLYKKQEKGSLQFFCTLGTGKWFRGLGIDGSHVQEMDWWDERVAGVNIGGQGEDSMRIVCTPSQHFSGRSPWDHYKTLWASWAVQHLPVGGEKGASVYFGGDTGYSTIPMDAPQEEIAKLPPCPAFKEIGERLGPFDLGLIPIGAYSQGNRFSAHHSNPEQSVEIHKDIRAKRSIGIHWLTWQLSSEPIMEPKHRFLSAGKAAGLPDGEVGVCDIGETVVVGV